jgi:hypothetical protein
MGQKKKAQEMLMKVTDYLMSQELPSSNMSIDSVESGSSSGSSHNDESKSIDSLEEGLANPDNWKTDDKEALDYPGNLKNDEDYIDQILEL